MNLHRAVREVRKVERSVFAYDRNSEVGATLTLLRLIPERLARGLPVPPEAWGELAARIIDQNAEGSLRL